jgi:hypothetical protein
VKSIFGVARMVAFACLEGPFRSPTGDDPG